MEDAYAAYQNQLYIESLGLFWVTVEVVILYAILALRRHLDEGKRGEASMLTVREKKRALYWGSALLAVATTVLARHLITESFPEKIRRFSESNPENLAEGVQQIYAGALATHLIVWSCFITAWVILEIAIVYTGYGVYAKITGRKKGRGTFE